MPAHPDTAHDSGSDPDEDDSVPMDADDAGRSTADTQEERNRDDESPS